jgi:hypothetical protein
MSLTDRMERYTNYTLMEIFKFSLLICEFERREIIGHVCFYKFSNKCHTVLVGRVSHECCAYDHKVTFFWRMIFGKDRKRRLSLCILQVEPSSPTLQKNRASLRNYHNGPCINIYYFNLLLYYFTDKKRHNACSIQIDLKILYFLNILTLFREMSHI